MKISYYRVNIEN